MDTRSSVSIAKERLEALVVSDRMNCNPENYALIRKELYRVLSKYMELSEKNFEVIVSRSYIHIQLTGEKH